MKEVKYWVKKITKQDVDGPPLKPLGTTYVKQLIHRVREENAVGYDMPTLGYTLLPFVKKD